MKEVKCNIPVINRSINRAAKYRPEKADEVSRRLGSLFNTARALSSVTPVNRTAVSAATAADVNRARNALNNAMRIAEVAQINPGSVRSLGYFLAQTFGLRHRGFGLANELTDPGAVRSLMIKLRKRGEGTAHVVLANVEYIDAAIEADKVFKQVYSRYKRTVTGDEWHRLKLDLTEIGAHPYVQNDLGLVGPAGLRFLRDRQARMFETIQRLGITQSDADLLADASTKVLARQRAALEIANALGVKLDDTGAGFISYIPRTFSNEALRRFAWYRSGNEVKIVDASGEITTQALPTSFTRARNSFHITVEDEVVLDAILVGKFGEGFYEEIGVSDVSDLLADNATLARQFASKINERAPELIDAMVDAGVVSRIPMTSTELYDFLVQRNELPFKNLNEMLPYRFEDMAVTYRAQLERLAGRSLLANFTAKAALEGNWGITEAQRLADPEKYKAWVKLGSPDANNNDVVFSHQEINRLGLGANVFQNANVYVHPVVASMYKSQVKVFTDPSQLGAISRFFHQLNTTFKTLALSSSGFIFRQLYTPIFQVHAAGGRIDQYITDMFRSFTRLAELRSQGKSMDTFHEMLDDTKRIYKGNSGDLLTERELWTWLRERGEVAEIIPWLGTNLSSSSYTMNSGLIESIKRNARYTQDVLQNYDNLGYKGVAANLIFQYGDSLNSVGDKLFHWFSTSNVLFDNVGRFSLIKSLTDTTKFNATIRTAQGNIEQFPTLDSAVVRMNEYFFDYSDRGDFDNFMNHVRPFWMFMSRNTFSVWRMMVRHPSRFVAYNRLYAAMNNPDDQEDIPEGALKSWMAGTYPQLWVSRRDEQGNPLEVVVMPRVQFDPIAEGTRGVTNVVDSVLYANGVWPNSRWSNRAATDIYEDFPWNETVTNRFLAEQLEQSFGAYKAIAGLVTGRDVRFDIPLRGPEARDSVFLGVRMPPMARYVLENTLPTLASINRSNPGFIFGKNPEFDAQGNMISPGIPSWAGASRERRDRASDFRSWWQRAASIIGFNSYSLDIMTEMGYKREDIRRNIDAGRDYVLNRERQLLEQEMTPEQRRVEYEKLEYARAVVTALEFEYREIEHWANERDMPWPAAVRALQREGIRTNTLNNLPKEMQDEVIDLYYGDPSTWPTIPTTSQPQ